MEITLDNMLQQGTCKVKSKLYACHTNRHFERKKFLGF